MSNGAAAELCDVLATAELGSRPSRPANFRVEAQVMAILAQTMADRPKAILEVLVATAVELCGGGTCGISLVEKRGEEEIFRWVAIAGTLSEYVGGSTPRHFSPCGVTMDQGEPQLFILPARYFPYFEPVHPPIYEGLVIPFYHHDQVYGTIWIVTHDPERKFDGEDVRLMTHLGAFTAAGLTIIRALNLGD